MPGLFRRPRGDALCRYRLNAQTGSMQCRAALAILLLTSLAGCTTSPAALGITGPKGGGDAAPASAQDPLDNPNALQSGSRYQPNVVPTTGGGHFWGYD